jgi:hypothetical protein
MTNVLKKALLILSAMVACLICPTVSGQEKQNSRQEKQSGCRDHQSLWRDAQGKPVRLSSIELEKRRIHCEAPKLPGQWCGKGQIMFLVVINAEGKIECAESLTEFHPWIKPNAMDALKKWTFKPVEVDGKPIAALGIVFVDVSWDSSPTQCRGK